MGGGHNIVGAYKFAGFILAILLFLFRLLKRMDFPSMKFSLYFLGYEKAEDIPTTDDKERIRWTFSRKATVELTQ